MKSAILAGAATFAGAALLVGAVTVQKSQSHEVSQMSAVVARLQSRLEAPQAPARPNVRTDFSEDVATPTRDTSAFVDPQASVIGRVELGERVYVAPFASIRGDEGQPIYLGNDSNVQDGVVIHALETVKQGQQVPGRTYVVEGQPYAVYVGKRVSLAHQALVHGPAWVEDDVFVGMQAMVFKARVGAGSVIEPGAKVIGVTIPPGRFVPAGQTITSQDVANQLPAITPDYPFRGLNEAVVHVNTSLAKGYRNVPSDSAARGADAKKGKGKAEGGGH